MVKKGNVIKTNKIVAYFAIILLAVLVMIMVRPFILAIVSSMILAYIVHPFYIKLRNFLKNPNIAAGLLSIIVIIAVSVPVGFLMPTIIRQTFGFYTIVQKVDFTIPLKHIAPRIFASPENMKDVAVMINQAVAKTADIIMNKFENLLINLPLVFMQFIVMLFVFFFTVRDSDEIVRFIRGLSPLKEKSERRFIQKFNDITKSVIHGMFIIGLIQGILAGIGFFIFKVPQPLFLTIVAIFFGILPYIGTWAVWVPVTIALIVSGSVNAGIGLAVYSIFAVAVAEFIRPYIIKRRAKIPIVTVLIGMIGGVYAFGVIGFIIGPLILEYFLLFLECYRNKNLDDLFE